MAGQNVSARPQFLVSDAPLRASSEVAQAIQQASRSSGVGFKYLLASAAQESGFRADAQARGSSAAGLFQFTTSTWLQMVRDHGAKHGLTNEARQITTDPGGRIRVADPKVREQILALRTDPRLSAAMAAEYARVNRSYLERKMGGPVGDTAVYMAHFLGPGGAAKFLAELRDNPNRSAADLLPKAAASNPKVFYGGGEPRSVAQVYDWAFRRIDTRATALVAMNAPAEAARNVASAPAAVPPARKAAAQLELFTSKTVAPDTMLALARLNLFSVRGRKTSASG